jgi:D-alanine-D-alanine ligase
MNNKKIKVGLIVGGASPEREVSKSSGKSIYEALQNLNYSVKIYDPGLGNHRELDENYFSSKEDSNLVSSKNYIDLFSSDSLKSVNTAFIALHGTYGEDGMIQSLFELNKIRYTGSGVLASALSMNKGLTKVLLQHNNVPTPKWLIVDKPDTSIQSIRNEIAEIIFYPCVVKPNDQGSAIGLTICKNENEIEDAIKLARKYSDSILIEEYITGHELTVGIVDDLSLPPLEIKPKHDFYDYECKYTKGMSEYEVPAKFPEAVLDELKVKALAAYKSINCKSYGRIDFRVNPDHQIYCLEINTLPGMTSTSLLPKTAKAAGISFEELIDRIVKNSLEC